MDFSKTEKETIDQINSLKDLNDLEKIRLLYLGKKGLISLEMKKALDSTRANILGKPIGQDSGIIEVKSDDVEFSIMIHIEHGGKKVIIDGNVGGKYVTFKEVKEEKIGNDYLSIVPSVLFKMAGGKEDQSVKIKSMVE